MSEAKNIVAAIEAPAKEIRELLNKLRPVKVTDEQNKVWISARQDF